MGLAFRFGLSGLVGAHDRAAILSMIRRDGGRGGGGGGWEFLLFWFA